MGLYGWHDNDLRVDDLTVDGTLTFGDAATDNLIIKGRVSSMSAAGAAIQIAASYAYGEGIEMRYQVTDWTLVGDSFKGMYIRAEAATNTASGKSIYGAELYGVCNNVTMDTGSLWGAMNYAYVKGAAAVTINNMYAVQGELSWDASRTGDCTITTAAACFRAKITAGKLLDYTKLDGYEFTVGDMDGGDRLLGNGLVMQDDAGTGGTCTLTTGVNINIGCTTGISIAGASTDAIKISGDATRGLNITSGCTATDGILIAGACADAIEISGINTANAINISGAQTTGNAIAITSTGTLSGTLKGIAIDYDGVTLGTQSNTGIEVFMHATYGNTGTEYAIYASGDGTTVALCSDDKAAVTIGGTVTTGLSIGASTTAVSLTGAMTTGISMAGGESYNPIHIGTKANTKGSGLDMSGADSYDDHNGVMIFCDDGGSLAATYTTSAIWTRYLISQSQTSNTATGAYLQMKSLAATFATCDYSATKAYLELAGAVTLSSGGLAVINAGLELGGAFTDIANMLSGIDVNLNDGANTLSTAKNSAGVRIRKTSGSTAGWPIGLYIEDSGATTGIKIGTSTTGIAITGATTTGINITGNATTAISISTGTIVKVLDATATVSGVSTLNCFTVNLTDSTSPASGITRGIYLNETISGAKTVSAEHNGISIDQTVSGATPYLYGFVYWSQDSGDPVIGFAAPISIYQDNLGSNLGAYVGIDIGLALSNAPADRYSYFRLRTHSTAIPKSVFRFEADCATSLFDTTAGTGVPNFITINAGTTPAADGILIAVNYHGTPYYIKAASAWS